MSVGSIRDSVTKEYATDEIVVEWEPRLCCHSRNCVRSLPQVFDESSRPWVKVDAAMADEIEVAAAHRRRFADHSGVRQSDAPGQLLACFRGTDELEAASGSVEEAEVVDVPEASRYELRLGGRLIGLAAYQRRDGRIAFAHTEVEKSHVGRGFGSRLAGAALDVARRQGARRRFALSVHRFGHRAASRVRAAHRRPVPRAFERPRKGGGGSATNRLAARRGTRVLQGRSWGLCRV